MLINRRISRRMQHNVSVTAAHKFGIITMGACIRRRRARHQRILCLFSHLILCWLLFLSQLGVSLILVMHLLLLAVCILRQIIILSELCGSSIRIYIWLQIVLNFRESTCFSLILFTMVWVLSCRWLTLYAVSNLAHLVCLLVDCLVLVDDFLLLRAKETIYLHSISLV